MFLSDEDKEIQKILLEAYPDRIITGLYKNKELESRVNRRWNELNISRREYTRSLGFFYSGENWGKKVDEVYVDSFLNENFPNKTIQNISDINKKSQKVGVYIRELCKEKSIKEVEYLKEKGYVVLGGKKGRLESECNISSSFLYNPLSNIHKYNRDLIRELKESYGVKYAKIAELLNISRQAVDSLFKKDNFISTFTEDEEELEEEIQQIVMNLIKNYEVEYDKNGILIKFYWSNKEEKIAIVYKYKGDIKCSFNHGSIVDNMFKKYEYYKFKEFDIFTLKQIKQCNEIEHYTTWNGDSSKIRIKNKKIEGLINKNRVKHKMNQEEYLSYLGFNLYTFLDEVEDRVYKKMKENLDSEGNVKIEIKDNNGKQSVEYARMYDDIRRLGKNGIKDMAEYFGFRYERQARSNVEDKHRKMLEERYVVNGNKVYIDTQDKFYLALRERSKRVGKTLDEYIEGLGFKRIKKGSIPKGHVLYDWRKEYNHDVNNLIEKATIFLEKLANESNEVYLKSDSYEYETMWKYSYALDLKINELIEKCGFIRVYQPLSNETIAEVDKLEFNIETIEETMRSDILVQLDNLESNFKEKTTTSNKINRNNKLPKLLKRLYEYKCQLCNKEESIFPSIEMINGEEYVEVHHITQLSEGRDIEDESNSELDSYKNCIVVCCFHHKFLHYHHGGFKKLKLINGKLCFESEKGDVLPIITNYHLSALK